LGAHRALQVLPLSCRSGIQIATLWWVQRSGLNTGQWSRAARRLKRGYEQKYLDQTLAKVDLHLLAGPRLEADAGARFGVEFLPERRYRQLHRAQADIDALLGNQFLANHVGIAAMEPKPLSQPILN